MKLLITLAAVLVGAGLFTVLKVPAGALLGGVAGAAFVNLATDAGVVEVPSWLRFIGFAILGWAIGSTVTTDSLRALAANAPALAAAVLGILATSGVIAVVLARFSNLDIMTSYLATSPGALSQMSITAKELQADAVTVITVHTARVIAVLITVPIITRFLGD